MEKYEPVVSVEWLHANLKNPNVKVVDASWYLPHEQRDAFQEYKAAHIPGAEFFDIDQIADLFSKKNQIADQKLNLPHMLPSEEAFAAAVTALGIQNQDGIVVYDRKGLFSAPRVWWMFRAFGHDKVWVLDGGLPRWLASGFQVQSDASTNATSKAVFAREAVKKVYSGQLVGPTTFRAKLRPDFIWTIEQVKQNMDSRIYQHIDARPKGRFDGVAPEPREDVPSGHMPGTKCIPFRRMLDSSQMLLSEDKLRENFKLEGIALDSPIVASCGTGVTACILNLGLYRLGKTDVPIYDGSWTEWATQPDNPIITSAPAF